MLHLLNNKTDKLKMLKEYDLKLQIQPFDIDQHILENSKVFFYSIHYFYRKKVGGGRRGEGDNRYNRSLMKEINHFVFAYKYKSYKGIYNYNKPKLRKYLFFIKSAYFEHKHCKQSL